MRIVQRRFRLLGHDQHHPRGSFEACLAVEAHGQWVRAGMFYGEAPGSQMAGKHFAFWRTAEGAAGVLHAWNVRFGWWPRPCVTMLLHTRPVRA